jgi:hypothetical protein
MTRTRRIADRFAVFILAGVVSCSLIGALSAAPPQSYDDLLAQAKQNATAVDFTALRYAYAESAQYNPYDPNDAELYKFMVNAMNARDCTSAMKHAQAILEITTSVSMHTSPRRFVSGNSIKRNRRGTMMPWRAA